MSDWLDDFQMMGTKLNEGEKSLMRFAMKKEQERIIQVLEDELYDELYKAIVIGLIKTSGHQK
jgi:hypothetical protein